jgi:uncharacterized protein (DUF2147 family)
MKHIKQGVSALVLSLFATTLTAQEASIAHLSPNTPVGYWKTIDDVTGKPKSIIHISKAENNILVGKVIKIFPKEGSSQNKVCTACSGDKHNQPIVGMVILSGLKASESQWDSGKIMDPENGKTYSCSLRMAENGKKLNVHGYVGLPILGRSQLWERVDNMSNKA